MNLDELKEKLRAGAPINLEDADRQERTIPVEVFAEILTEPARVCDVPIDIMGAIFTGDWVSHFSHFLREVRLTRCEFLDSVNLSGSTFERLVALEDCTFRSVLVFQDIKTKFFLAMVGCRFESDAVFRDASIGTYFDASSSQFARADFERIVVEKSMLVRAEIVDGEVVAPRFAGEARFLDARIGATTDFTGAQFEALADFSRVHIGGKLFMAGAANRLHRAAPRTRFAGPALFIEMSVGGTATFDGALFEGEVRFDRVRMSSDVTFTPVFADEVTPTEFRGPASMHSAIFERHLVAVGCRFGGGLDATFAEIRGTCVFSSTEYENGIVPTIFGGALDMRSATIAGNLELNGCEFNAPIICVRMQVGGQLLCIPRSAGEETRIVEFHDDAIFQDMKVSATANFSGTVFHAAASFERFACDGTAFFHPVAAFPCRFKGEANFQSAKILGSAEFEGVHFEKAARFQSMFVGGNAFFRPTDDHKILFDGDAKFLGMRVDGVAIISGVSFAGFTDLTDATIGGELNLTETHCKDTLFLQRLTARVVWLQRSFIAKRLDLSEVRVSTLSFANIEDERIVEHATLPPEVDLRGARYDRLDADWRPLLAAQTPYDRSVYETVERYLRSSGDDRAGGDVYYARRLREASLRRARIASRTSDLRWYERLGEALRVVLDFFARFAYRYGVRPLRLLVFSVVVITLGTFVFSEAGSVVLKSGAPAAVIDPSRMQALGFSLRLFVPIVELPTGADWQPSRKASETFDRAQLHVTCDAYAALHRIAGAILVPLGVAALTGLLIRRR